MSQRSAPHLPIVEWSPDGATAYDPSTRQIHRGSLAGVAANLGSREVVLAIARRSAFIRAVRLPDAPRNELHQVLAMQIGQFFPVPASELAFDFRLTQDKTAEGRLVVVAAVRSDLLRAAYAELKSAGLRARLVVPAALGSWLLAYSLGHSTCAVAELSDEGLSIDVIADGELRYSRIAPAVAGEADTEAEIVRTFGVAGVSPAPILATNGLNLQGAAARSAMSTLQALDLPGLDAVGLNLELPETRRDREQRKQSQRVRLAALLGFATVAVWAYIFVDRSATAREADVAARRLKSTVTKAKSATKTAQAAVAKEERIADALRLAFNPAQRFSDVLMVAGNSTPGTVWLTGATADRGRPITLRGTATSQGDVASYLQRLSDDPRFRDVKLVFANNATIEEKAVVQFSLSLHAKGNLPMFDTKGAKK